MAKTDECDRRLGQVFAFQQPVFVPGAIGNSQPKDRGFNNLQTPYSITHC
jgi:hypothetical protein